MTRRIEASGWGEAEIRRFWDWVGAREALEHAYFGRDAGKGIVGFLRFTGRRFGRALDYGCGRGFLCGELVAEGIQTYGVDFSEESVARVNQRLSANPKWKGAGLPAGRGVPFEDGFFDLVTLVETIEHMQQADIVPLLSELKRVLRPSGLLFITAPDRERLDENMSYCPFCDTEFHRWQHMRSVDSDYLCRLLAAAGYQVVFSAPVDFSTFQNPVRPPAWRTLSAGSLRDWINYRLMVRRDRSDPRPFPNGREFQFRLRNGTPHNVCALAARPG